MDVLERMTPDLYAKTMYFKNYRTEGWGEPCSMSKVLVYGADKLRALAGKPLIVHCGFEDRKTGYHPKGLAMDCHIVDTPLLQQLYLALLIPEFTGIGVYPNWNNKGLHLDVRELNGMPRTMWQAKYVYKGGKKVQEYKRLDNIYNIVYL
jgi:hypothetical protein